MEQPMKYRPKSAPVITNAYVQNKREDECLCVRLDSLHYQQHASLIRMKQAVSDVVRQRKNLLTQRAITPQSSLDHVMDEIHTYKRDRNRLIFPKSPLPPSTELYMEQGMNSKWPPSPSSLPSITPVPSKERDGKKREEASQRRFTVMDGAKVKSTENVLKCERKTSPEQRRSRRDKELLTYKELSQIACLENISTREAERQRQQKQMEKQQLTRSMDCALQEKVQRFLQKLE